MKKALRNISIIVLVLLSLSFIAYKTYWAKESKRVKFLHQRTLYPELKVDRYYTLGFTPARVTELNDSVLLLENQQEKEILLFNMNTAKTTAFMNKNSGVRNSHPFISQVDVMDEWVFVTDSKTSHITTYDLKGNKNAVDSIPFAFSRTVNVSGDSIFLFQRTVMELGRTRLQFSLANIKTGKIVQENLFSDVFAGKENSDMIYDGFFLHNGPAYYYVCYQENLFFSFNKKMDLLYKSNMIYSAPSPVIKRTGRLKYVESSYIGVVNITSSKDSLMVLSNVGDKMHKGQRVIDVYNGSNGTYVHSIAAPNNHLQIPTEVFKGAKRFYFIYGDGIGYSNYSL